VLIVNVIYDIVSSFLKCHLLRFIKMSPFVKKLLDFQLRFLGLTHKPYMVNMNGNSYRIKETKELTEKLE